MSERQCLLKRESPTSSQLQESIWQIRRLAEKEITRPVPETAPPHTPSAVLERIRSTSAVFAALVCYSEFSSQADLDENLAQEEVLKCRARFCEVLALRLLRRFSRDERISKVLTYRFPCHEGCLNALELAAERGAIVFLADSRIQECLDEVWRGRILFSEAAHASPGVPFTTFPERFRALFMSGLEIPRFRYYIENMVLVVLLTLFAVVMRNRTAYLTTLEIILYIFAFAFVLDEVKEMSNNGWRFYALSFHNWFDLSIGIVFMTALVLRVSAFVFPSNAFFLTDTAFSVLSCNAILLWLRLLQILSVFEFLGVLLVVFRVLLWETLLYVVLIGLAILGFAHTFYGLVLSHQSQDPDISFPAIVLAIFKGVLGDPDFDTAHSMDSVIGIPLYSLCMIICYVILLNLLIAVFSETYSNIVEQSRLRYLHQSSVRVLSYARAWEGYQTVVPFNLVLLLIVPLRLALPSRYYRAISIALFDALFCWALLLLLVIDSFAPNASTLRLLEIKASSPTPSDAAANIEVNTPTDMDPSDLKQLRTTLHAILQRLPDTHSARLASFSPAPRCLSPGASMRHSPRHE